MSLQVHALARHYGGVKALDGVSFEVPEGQCVALIGPNGAGKSTCFACLAGQETPDAGRVLWQGRDLHRLSPAQRLALGVTRTFQVAQTFEALSVQQNLQLALSVRQLSWWRRLGAWPKTDPKPQRVAQALTEVGLTAQAHTVAADLPYGAKKRLELALALAGWPQTDAALCGRPPRLLLLDEPAAGLAPAERHDMMRLVRQLAQQGVTVLYTEHNMDAVFGVADRVLVLMQGQLVADGDPLRVAQDPQVRQRYLGQDFDAKAWTNQPLQASAQEPPSC